MSLMLFTSFKQVTWGLLIYTGPALDGDMHANAYEEYEIYRF